MIFLETDLPRKYFNISLMIEFNIQCMPKIKKDDPPTYYVLVGISPTWKSSYTCDLFISDNHEKCLFVLHKIMFSVKDGISIIRIDEILKSWDEYLNYKDKDLTIS
jgi:hypothetical protein